MSRIYKRSVWGKVEAWNFRIVLVAIAMSMMYLLAGCEIGVLQGPPSSGQPKTRKQPTPSTRKLDPRQAERLKAVMSPIIQHMNNPLPMSEVRITVLEDKHINAANAGGGEFYVTTGLLELANNDQLRGVMAHEAAHADLGHVAKAQVLGTGLNIGMIILDQVFPSSKQITPIIADLGVMKPFSRQEEYEADSHGVEILKRAGYNGKLIMSSTLVWLVKTEGSSGGFLQNHPDTQDRIQRINQLP